MKKLIKGGYVVDPATNKDGLYDILIEGKKISKVDIMIEPEANMEIIDATGQYVFPGFIDMHVHLREPGQEYKETVTTGLNAAAKGGFTTVACMPNTDPIIDNKSVIEALEKKMRGNKVNLKVIGAATKGISTDQLTEMGNMKEAGIVAISNDGKPVPDANTVRRVLEYAKQFDLTLIEHCEDLSLAKGGFIHEGYYSTTLGLKGIPREAEDLIVARDIALANMVDGKIHIAHISSKNAVELVREGKRKGINVTAEVTPHHLVLTDEAVSSFNTSTKINPPLRSEEDRQALIEGVLDGTIDIIATDHAPHARWEKEVEYAYAPFGAIGLETAFSLLYTTFVKNNTFTFRDLIKKMANKPGEIFKLDGTLKESGNANIAIFNPNIDWTVEGKNFESMGQNTPFEGWNLEGVITTTLVKGDYAVKDSQVVR